MLSPFSPLLIIYFMLTVYFFFILFQREINLSILSGRFVAKFREMIKKVPLIIV